MTKPYFVLGDRIKIDTKRHICIAIDKYNVAVFAPYLESKGSYGQRGVKCRIIYSSLVATPNAKESVNFFYEWDGKNYLISKQKNDD